MEVETKSEVIGRYVVWGEFKYYTLAAATSNYMTEAPCKYLVRFGK